MRGFGFGLAMLATVLTIEGKADAQYVDGFSKKFHMVHTLFAQHVSMAGVFTMNLMGTVIADAPNPHKRAKILGMMGKMKEYLRKIGDGASGAIRATWQYYGGKKSSRVFGGKAPTRPRIKLLLGQMISALAGYYQQLLPIMLPGVKDVRQRKLFAKIMVGRRQQLAALKKMAREL